MGCLRPKINKRSRWNQPLVADQLPRSESERLGRVEDLEIDQAKKVTDSDGRPGDLGAQDREIPVYLHYSKVGKGKSRALVDDSQRRTNV